MNGGSRPGPLLFYVDGHGFGHATRALAVMREVRRRCPERTILVRTSAPEFLFREDPAGLRLLPGAVGPGTVQADPLTLDAEESLRLAVRHQVGHARSVQQETERLSRHAVGLVAGDIPPLAFDVARRLGVPSVALGNFSWDWIYEPYVQGRTEGQDLLRALRRSYRQADLLLRMPLHGDMSVFPHIEDIPHVVRRSAGDPARVRRMLGVTDETRPLVLVSFGGFGPVSSPGSSPRPDPGDFRFVVPGESLSGIPQDAVRLPVDHHIPHEDLVSACDAVISKPGYGTVVECIASRTPLLYTSRDNFREYPVLVEGLQRTARCGFLPREDLLAVRWRSHLEDLLSDRRPWPAVRVDGAKVAATRLLEVSP
jgi:L-arabinokinase